MIIIGEKINGTIPSVGRSIAAGDEDFIRLLAVKQSEAGSAYIDVCAGVDPDSELETMKWLLEIVQTATDVPISIDSPDPLLIKDTLKYVSKPGLINSVSLEGEKTKIIFPQIADTDWECVALLCDDKGVPATVEKRLQIAREIVDRAADYGISHSRLYIDPLVTTLSTDGSSLVKFMECSREIKSLYPEIHITSGLSNISYGLPVRTSINQAFLTLAMSAGMDSAIMDPTRSEMLAAILTTDALLGNDRFCRKLTTAFRKGIIGQQKC